MQVNSINSSTSFGVLRITPGAEKALKRLPTARKAEYVESLEKAAYDLAEVRNVHLEIAPDLTPIVDAAVGKRFKGFFNFIKPENQTVQFATLYDGAERYGYKKGDRVIISYDAESKEIADAFYKDVQKTPNNISVASKLAQFIDKSILRNNGRKAPTMGESSLDMRIDRLVKNNDYYEL